MMFLFRKQKEDAMNIINENSGPRRFPLDLQTKLAVA